MQRPVQRLSAIALFAALLVSWPAASSESVPPSNQALLVMRILAFDRKVADRAQDVVRIAVVYKEGSGESDTAQREIAQALEDAARRVSVSGLPVRVVTVPYSPTLDANLGKLRAAALYVCPGLDDVIPAISRAARAHSTLTFSGQESFVSNGLAVALVRRDARAAIVINLPESRAEGADLDSGLLQIAEVRR